ncbi:hypothetical protein ACIU1J_32375 [Azospirillum doebereinerae]|uniref:hypothetical protein n=1 Tax=Azospirillum doebereinerae TaxID=92933 RepID=UPI001EE6065B|nr:hypothetical protein [Azospirillum doebereinerae]MCG5243968.1 hypothetical protein [Azospirillum doebereinerae]
MSVGAEAVDAAYDEFGEDATLVLKDGTARAVRVRRVAGERQQALGRTPFALSADRGAHALVVRTLRGPVAAAALRGARLSLVDGDYDVGEAEAVGAHGWELSLPLSLKGRAS